MRCDVGPLLERVSDATAADYGIITAGGKIDSMDTHVNGPGQPLLPWRNTLGAHGLRL